MKYKSIVVVYGGRNWTRKDVLFRKMDKFHAHRKFDLVVAGGADGVDKQAIEWAKSRGIDYREEPARWSDLDATPCVVKHGKFGLYNALAGPNRNQLMLDKYQPHYTVEFPGGTGTEDMRRRVALHASFGKRLKRIITVRKKQ